MNQNTITHASVFSGIGGPEVAAVMLGWENLFHCEINPFGRTVLDYWFPNSKSYEDITKTDFSEWRGRVNVLTGGFPCQPFSSPACAIRTAKRYMRVIYSTSVAKVSYIKSYGMIQGLLANRYMRLVM